MTIKPIGYLNQQGEAIQNSIDPISLGYQYQCPETNVMTIQRPQAPSNIRNLLPILKPSLSGKQNDTQLTPSMNFRISLCKASRNGSVTACLSIKVGSWEFCQAKLPERSKRNCLV